MTIGGGGDGSGGGGHGGEGDGGGGESQGVGGDGVGEGGGGEAGGTGGGSGSERQATTVSALSAASSLCAPFIAALGCGCLPAAVSVGIDELTCRVLTTDLRREKKAAKPKSRYYSIALYSLSSAVTPRGRQENARSVDRANQLDRSTGLPERLGCRANDFQLEPINCTVEHRCRYTRARGQPREPFKHAAICS